MNNKFFCVNCGLWWNSHNHPQTYSGIYGAYDDMVLCCICAKYEKKLLEDTNYQPEVLCNYIKNYLAYIKRLK